VRRLAPAFLLAALLGACAGGDGSVSSVDYAPQYDFSEFYALTNGKAFRVVVAGNPFPALPIEESKRLLLPVMQANRPRPRLTFTYEVPAERPHPDYRLVLVFDAANDLTAARVCADQIRLKPVPSPAGRFTVFGVYCRNDLALTQAVSSTAATGPDDPRVGELFSHLFLVLFSDAPPFHRPPRGFFWPL